MSAVLAARGQSWLRPSIDFIAERLCARRAVTVDAHPRRVETYENTGHGWEHERGTLAHRGRAARGRAVARAGPRRAVHQLVLRRRRAASCFRLVDVGAGTRRRLRGQGRQGRRGARQRRGRPALDARRARARRRRRDLDRARALHAPGEHAGRAAVGQHSVRRGAAVVRVQGDAARGAAPARARWPPGRYSVHVDIATTFHRGPNRTLVAEIPGAARADERVVLVAHVQEPGANDNASGSGTLLAAALALHDAIADGALPPPRANADLHVARRDPRQRALDQASDPARARRRSSR